MESNSRNLRDVESVILTDTITCIDSCIDYIAVGCLDDTVSIWRKSVPNLQSDPFITKNCNAMGIIDISFNKKSTQLAASCMDSTIRVYDLHTTEVSTIECDVMQNWKVLCVGDWIATAGDYGRINCFDSISRERIKKMTTGDVFLTALAKTPENNQQMIKEQHNFIATGNNNGQVFIQVNPQSGKKDRMANFRPHFQMIRDLTFIEDNTKLLSASDDGSIKMIDVASEKVNQSFEGHKLGVTSVCTHSHESRIFFSASFDKTIKIWDLRAKDCVGTAITGSPLWDCKFNGKHLMAGGDSGTLSIYSLE